MQNRVELDLKDYIDPDVGSCIIATGTHKGYEPFRVVYTVYSDHKDDEIRIEVREHDNCLGEEVWLTIPKYTHNLRSSSLKISAQEVFILRQNIYKCLLHCLSTFLQKNRGSSKKND